MVFLNFYLILICKKNNHFRPPYDLNLPLSGYIVSSAGRLSISASSIQKEVERLGGTFTSRIDETVGIIISSKGIFYLSFVLNLMLMINIVFT